MAIAQLFFKKGNFIGDIELDVIINEGATASARITKNPVENGADINDHIIIDPMAFTMVGVKSDAGANLIESLTAASIPSKETWEQLLALQASRIPFELVTNLKTYPNVFISSISESQDKDTSKALFFSATMAEVVLVGEEVLGPEQFNDGDVADQMVPTVQGGQKSLGETS